MCRFLIVKSKEKIVPDVLLRSFALACEKSMAPDGGLQNDGYGIAWKEENTWQLKKSLAPIWTEQGMFQEVPQSDFFIAHARSAARPIDKNIIEYNQPFLDDDFLYVFNGMIKGVRLSIPLNGIIGSQKLFSLLKHQIKEYGGDIHVALRKLSDLMMHNAKKIEGMNIGLISGGKIYVLNQYDTHENYYGLYFYEEEKLKLISSEPFGSFAWQRIKKGEIYTAE